MGSLVKPFVWKNSCSLAVKVKFAPLYLGQGREYYYPGGDPGEVLRAMNWAALLGGARGYGYWLTEFSPLQNAFLDHGALQCGFCTSGMLMATTAFLRENPKPTEEQIREGIDANICRCTGYNSIIRAVTAVANGEYKEAK